MSLIPNLGIFNNFAQSSPSSSVGFRGVSAVSFPQTNPLISNDRYSSDFGSVEFEDARQIEKLARSNPRVMELWNEIKELSGNPYLNLKVNIDELRKLKHGHMLDTRAKIATMYSYLPENIKSEVNMQTIQKAGYLHDYGKVLIPKEILTKNGALDQNEKKIMDMHSELGYELLKMQGVEEDVLRLVKYHHQTPNGSGYPAIDNDFDWSVEAQMLSASDKYSALTENRDYRQAYSKDEALDIMSQDVENGIISPEVFNALKKSV